MKMAIISDLHYPQTITMQTKLRAECHYQESFYSDLDREVAKLTPAQIDAFLINGDFAWDFKYLSPLPIIPTDWNIYNSHIYHLIKFRGLLHHEIPLLFVEGNHEFWMNTYIHEYEGTVVLNLADYHHFLTSTYLLSKKQADKVLSTLRMSLQLSSDEEEISLGSNIFFLQGSGKKVKNFLVYGFSSKATNLDFRRHKNLSKPENSAFHQTILSIRNPPGRSLKNKVLTHISLLKPNSNRSISTPSDPPASLVPVIICSHLPPQNPKGFLKKIGNSTHHIHKIFWGHWHGVSEDQLKRIQDAGPFQCVLPEKNAFTFQIYHFPTPIN